MTDVANEKGHVVPIGMQRIPAARIVFSAEDIDTVTGQIREILAAGELTLGPHTAEFERKFAEYVGVLHAVAVNSGTSSLEIALRALEVEGKEVIVPANTFYATAGAVVHAGGRLRLVDIRADDLAPDLAALAAAVSVRTAAVVVVHIGGIVSPRLPEIRSFCDEQGLALVEDAAHAHGSTLDGAAAGTFGRAAAFSFYPTKVITSAEGGMLVTQDDRLASEARIYRDQGKAGFHSNEHIRLGYNWRMSEIHAAVGAIQLRRLGGFLASRREIARVYDAALEGVDGLRPLPIPKRVSSNYYKYIAMLDEGIDREVIKQRLSDEFAISCSGEVYSVPLHRQPVFRDHKSESYPAAERFCAHHICLPIYADMRREEAERVIQALNVVTSTIG